MSIKSWWESLFREPDVANFGLPKVTCDVPMPEVKPTKQEKDISEPVLSFLEVYKANPKRFRVKKEYSQEGDWSYTYKYTLYDSKENKTFSVYKIHHYGYCQPTDWTTITNTKWATQEEIQLVYHTISDERLARYKMIQALRSKVQREHLTKLYKGEQSC